MLGSPQLARAKSWQGWLSKRSQALRLFWTTAAGELTREIASRTSSWSTTRDILTVVRSLKPAGAEAISINGQRIMFNTEDPVRRTR